MPKTILVLVFIAVMFGPAAAQTAREGLSGRAIYDSFCAACHGPRGQGGPLGASFRTDQALNRSDAEILAVITDGRPEKGMMAFGGSLTKSEIAAVAAYIRQLQGKPPAGPSQTAPQTPDPRRELAWKGEELFNSDAGCIRCHSYFKRGGLIGPDLDGVAARLSPEALRRALLEPNHSIVEGYGAKEVVTKDGKTLLGRYRNETPQTIQLLNHDGTLWTTYFKDRLETLRDAGSLMPPDAFAKLDKEEQEALLAFLETLQ